MRNVTTATLLLISATVSAQKYESHDGCDAARWLEWDSIIIEFEGQPDEQADARSVRDSNKRVCEDWKAGKVTEAEANVLHDKAVEEWVGRVDRRQKARRLRGSGALQG